MLKAPIHRWGDLRKCDTPLRTIEAMYMHIAAHHTVDLIYWTGDLPPHDIWNQSRDGNVEVREKSRAIQPYDHIICAVGRRFLSNFKRWEVIIARIVTDRH